MESYVVIRCKHSDKKNTDYVAAYLVLGNSEYMLSLPKDALSIILNISARELANLPVGYESPKLNLEVVD